MQSNFRIFVKMQSKCKNILDGKKAERYNKTKMYGCVPYTNLKIRRKIMCETIIQFGEGVFLRGFVDYFLDMLNKSGIYDGKAVIIQPRAGGKTKILADQSCKYNLFLRGIRDGKAVSERYLIESVSRCVDPYIDYDAFIALAENPDFRFVISNTTEAGIAFDETCRLDDKPCASYPGKVTQLLYKRFTLGLGGFILMPCELIDTNGDALKDCVLHYADLWNLGDEFKAWLENENTFANTLVDRIVTGYPEAEKEALLKEAGFEDNCLDTAELFGLWVIEGNFEDELPLEKAGVPVIWTEDVSPYKKRKVRVLNGAHTSTVFPALLSGIETVGEAVNDDLLCEFLNYNLNTHILPMLGETEENITFTNAVLGRFANPYISHKWKAISLNSVSKFSVRVLPTMLECFEKRGEWPKSLVFSLACLVKYYKENEISDTPDSVDFIRENGIDAILANASLWGTDLTGCAELMKECTAKIENDGIREAVKWAIS